MTTGSMAAASSEESPGSARKHNSTNSEIVSAKRSKQDDGLWFPWNETWTIETPSMNLLDGVNAEKAKEFIHEHDVGTLGKLGSAVKDPYIHLDLCNLLGYVKGNDWDDLRMKLENLGSTDPTSWLNHMVLSFDKMNTECKVETSIFEEDLEKIDNARWANNGIGRAELSYVPIIVSGSSGAGKTTFARDILPQHLFEKGKKKKMFCVYMRRDSAVPDDSLDFIEMAKKVCEHIKFLLGLKGNVSLPLSEWELLLVIDEMGLKDDSIFIGNSYKLNMIQCVVENRIAGRVQIVLAGTGVDTITSNVNTNIGLTKVVVKPWTVNTVETLASKLDLKDIKSLELLKTPILSDLGSNARAAVSMICLLKESAKLFESLEQRDRINIVVREVAYEYIHSNGLGDCTLEERRHVAKVVLTTLRNTEKNSTLININCDNAKIRRVAVGLMGFHVETENTKMKLRKGEEFAVTVSPAITIVLSALMGAIETFTGSRKGIERIGALNALENIYVEYPEPTDSTIIPNIPIVRSAATFPATSATQNYKAPCVDSNMVFVNGMGAPHADVISKYRFWQFKKCRKNVADLNISNELAKMGVMQNRWYDEEVKKEAIRLQEKNTSLTDERKRKITVESSRWMTRRMIQYWEDDGGDEPISGPQADDVTASVPSDKGAGSGEGFRGLLYPFDQLFEEENVRTVHQWDTSANDALGMVQREIGEYLPEGQKITVVFATNAAGFMIKGVDDLEGFYIKRSHVDNKGFLKELSHLQYIVGNSDVHNTMLDLDSIEIKFLMSK